MPTMSQDIEKLDKLKARGLIRPGLYERSMEKIVEKHFNVKL